MTHTGKFQLHSLEYQSSTGYPSGKKETNFTWAVAGVFFLVVINLIRSWQTLKTPGLYMEDSLLFSYYYGHSRDLASVFSSHIGQNYLTVPANFFSWLFSRLDVRMQPYAYQWWGFCVAVAAASCIFFSGLMRSRVVLLIGPTVLGLCGLNHIYYYNTLIYIMYTGVLVLFCLLFFPDPRTRFGTVSMGMLFVLLPWSGPYSVLLIPAGLLHILLYRNHKKNMLILLGIMSTLIYFCTVEAQTSKLTQLKLWVVKRYFQVMVEKVAFLRLFDHVALYWGAVVLVAVVFSLFFFRRDICYSKNILIIFSLIFSSLALFFLSVKFPQYLFTSDCHRLVSVFFWLLFLLYVVDRICILYQPKGPVVIVFVFFFVGIVAAVNIKYPKYGWIKPIAGMQEFVNAVHFYEQEDLLNNNKYIVLHLPSHQYVMQPEVRVGSSCKDARPVRVDELKDARWEKFYKVEKENQANP